MQKFKPTDHASLEHGQHKIEEVKVEPVDDLVAEMKAANDKAVAALNEKKRFEVVKPRCSVNCSCEPCRDGNCGLCTKERGGIRERGWLEDRIYRDGPRPSGIEPDYRRESYTDYRREYYRRDLYDARRFDPRYDDPRRFPERFEGRLNYLLAQEWEKVGGRWDEDRPYIRNFSEEERWYSFKRWMDDRIRAEQESEYRRRLYDTPVFRVPMDIESDDWWKK